MRFFLVISATLLAACVPNHYLYPDQLSQADATECDSLFCYTNPQPANATKQPNLKQPSLNQYVKRLTQDLISTMDYADKTSVFGVTNFTYTDSDLKSLPVYSHHIAESMQHELHMFGLPVLDFKSTGSIQVTPDGDFARSRNYKELKGRVNMNYLISGTLTQLTDGVLVNAKIVGTETLAIVASSQIYIPESALEKITASEPDMIRIN